MALKGLKGFFTSSDDEYEDEAEEYISKDTSKSIKEVRNDLSIRMIQALESILLKTEIKTKGYT